MKRLVIPRSIRLRGALYRVRTSRRLDREGLAGHFDEATRTITLASGLSERAREEALLHEILHGVMPGDADHDPEEEAIVEAIDSPLLEAIRQLRWRRG